MLHIAPVDEEKLLGALLPGRFRFPHKSLDGTHRGLDIHGYQVAVHLTPKDIGDALTKSACPQVKHLGSIARQRESNIWVHKGNSLKGCKNIVELGRVGFKEFTPRRYIVKQVLYQKIATHGTGTWLLPHEARA